MNSREQQQLEALVRTIIRSNTGKGATSKLLLELAGLLRDSLMFGCISKLLAYRKGLHTVQKVTGQDPPKAHRLYLAFVSGNWSKNAYC